MNIIRSIIPFDLLVDTDMGVLKYTQISYPPDFRDLFHSELMKLIGPEHNDFLHYILIHREFANPLTVIYKPEKMIFSNIDDLYEKIMDKAEMVLKLSTSTAIMEMICKSFFVQDSLKFDILCKNKQEHDNLVERFNSYFETSKVPASIIVGNPDDIDIDLYGNIYIKDIHDISKYKHPIEGKNIIIANYDFNKETNLESGEILELPKMDVIDDYTASNRIQFIDVYSIDENKIGVG